MIPQEIKPIYDSNKSNFFSNISQNDPQSINLNPQFSQTLSFPQFTINFLNSSFFKD